MQRGFSLVELSIVLVILGLLTGGILAGQSLIRASELRSVAAEYQRWITASQTFRDKYMAIPGDMRDATRFWSLQEVGNGCVSNSASAVGSPGACDGNGNGILSAPAAASQNGEYFQFWRHLALAGLIEGSYSGQAGTGGVYHSIAGTNIPPSKLSNGLWFIGNWVPMTANATVFDGRYGNLLQIGSASGTSDPQNPVLKPEEAWNIDTKLDDGKPGAGTVVIRATGGLSTCAATTGTTAQQAAMTNADYLLSATGITCALVFRNQF